MIYYLNDKTCFDLNKLSFIDKIQFEIFGVNNYKYYFNYIIDGILSTSSYYKDKEKIDSEREQLLKTWILFKKGKRKL